VLHTLSDKNDDYASYGLVWASEYVQSEYITRRSQCSSDRAQAMIDAPSTISALSWLRDKLYESTAHKAIVLTGGQFTVDCVADTANPVLKRAVGVNKVDLNLRGLQVYAHGFTDVVAVNEGTYYIPQADNQAASFDTAVCFAVVKGTLYFFHITTSKQREIVQTGIVDILNYVSKFDYLKLTSYKYVFVVPSDIALEYQQSQLVPLKTKAGGDHHDVVDWPTRDKIVFSQLVATTKIS
jgi:cell division ATPase FtsA